MSTAIAEAPPLHADRETAAAAAFTFSGNGEDIRAAGTVARVPPGSRQTLGERLAALAPPDGGGAWILGGALPFDRGDEDCLWQASRAGTTELCRARPARGSPVAARLRAEPAPETYARAVAEALRVMARETGRSGALEKIVLARTLAARARTAIDPGAVLGRLARDPSVTAFGVALPGPAGEVQPRRMLVGATPELLLGKRGARISSHPLAGSAPRWRDPCEDAGAAMGLARSEKDRREHALVVDYILDILAPHCRQLGTPDGMGLASTRSMWHLGTRIEGVLRDETTPSALLAAELHPTPAVCGTPRERAACLIRSLEPVARDFYAGVVGWSNACGDGAWYVSIRCAEIRGAEARLYAGAGIVPGSDPIAETAETAAKFGALLDALGLPRDAAMAGIDPAG